MNKTVILLCTLLLYGAGCSSTRTGTTQRMQHRVQGQYAREAGLDERYWSVGKHLAVPERETAAGAPVAIEETGRKMGTAPPIVKTAPVTEGLEIVDQASIELRKEELVVGKRQVSNGGMLIRKIVETESVSQPVNLRREEYVLERVPASEASHIRDEGVASAFQGREIYLPLMREEAVSGKRILLSEGIRFGKRVDTDHETVSGQVRTEDVEIVKNPDLSNPRFSAVPRRPAHGTALQAVEAAAIPRPETTSDQIQLAHEELIVGKAEVDHGGVYLRKVIRTETASRPIDLQREEFVIERTPLGDKPVAAAEFQPYEVRVNLAREEAVVGTRNYPTEFVRIRKQLHTDTEIVSANVRKENVELVKLTGASEYQGTPGSTVEIETSSGKDMQITERVETKLSNGSLGRKYSTVNVSSRSGIVTLTGTVDSESEKTEIGDAIAKVSGVSKVNNELKIRR